LNIHPDDDIFVIFRDSVGNLEYIRPSCDVAEQGMYLELSAYKYYAFVDFRQVKDDAWGSYRHLNDYLAGRGVPNIDEALKELLLVPVLTPFRQIANSGYFQFLLGARLTKPEASLPNGLLDEAIQKEGNLLEGIFYLTGVHADKTEFLAETRRKLTQLLSLAQIGQQFTLPGGSTYPLALKYLTDGLKSEANWLALLGWVFVHHLGKLSPAEEFEFQSLTWLSEWQFSKQLNETYRAMGLDEGAASRTIATIRLLIDQQSWYRRLGRLPLKEVLSHWLADEEVVRYLGINRFKDVLWYNKESFEQFTWWMFALSALDAAADPEASGSAVIEQVLGAYDIAQKLLKSEKVSAFQVSKLIDSLK
jgi:hypothetical protein